MQKNNIIEELEIIKEKYGDERKTEITVFGIVVISGVIKHLSTR